MGSPPRRTEASLRSVRAFARGQRLDGTWTHTATAGGGAAGVAASQTLTLEPDGTFSGSSLGSLAASGAGVGTVAESGSASGSGTYELAGNTLVLRYAEGGEQRFSAFPFGDDADTASPEFLNVNGRMMSQQAR